VSLFIDPDPEIAALAKEVGADRVELYTGPYAEKHVPLTRYVDTAKAAIDAGLGINAGHDLSLDNLGLFIQHIPSTAEVSIGHAITADALKMGWAGAVSAYLTAIEFGHRASKEN
jgi:pyridoxine 5-phosphate synthase